MTESAFVVNVPEAESYVGALRERFDPSARLAATLPGAGIQATCAEVVLIENSSGLWKPMHSFRLAG